MTLRMWHKMIEDWHFCHRVGRYSPAEEIPMAIRIGMLLYPRLTQLDLTGPFEVLQAIPNAEVYLAWKTLEPVVADSKLALVPNMTLATCPELDVLFVPGGVGQVALMDDREVIDFLRSQG